MQITSQVFVLFLVALFGILGRKLHYFSDETIAGTTKFVVNVSLPVLTVYNMQREFEARVLINCFITILATLFLVSLMLGLSALVFRKRPRQRLAVLSTAMAFTNCGFMGYPVILATRPDWMIYAVAYNIATSLVTWTAGAMLFAGRKSVSLKKALFNPNILASLAGIAIYCSSFRFPGMINQSLELIGSLTTPMSMVLLGTRMAGIRLSELKDRDYHIAAVLRLFILPVIVWLVLRLLPIDRSVCNTIFILAAMPAGTVPSMMAELYHCESVFAARAIAWTTLLSLVSLPVMTLLL